MTQLSTNRNIPASLAAGAIGGLAGAFMMNQFQALLTKAQNKQVQPKGDADDATLRAAKAVSKYALGRDLTAARKKWAGPVVHYSFGAFLGAVYGLMGAASPLVKTGAGTAYGSAVWLAADEVFVPAFGLSDSPAVYPVSSHAQALAAHLVFGVTTDLTSKLVLRAAGRAQ